MKRTCTIGLIFGAALLSLVGCQSPSAVAAEMNDSLALGVLGPALSEPAPVVYDGVFRLGAGDALGEEVFAYYVASLRAEQFYATGAEHRPE
ncbi:MAG: hypothetical protein SYC29_12545 [Planctomycetota bacterium]|nr:hypothetical protein [Planctomycetota bacterium]